MQFKRLFTHHAGDPYASVHFREPQAEGDGFDVPLEHPEGWSLSAVEIVAEHAACHAVPFHKKPIEENTVPSWLWRQARIKDIGKKETSVRHIFDRVAGAAAYQGWKQDVWANETSARAFFDEVRHAMAARMIAVGPKQLAYYGLAWAYGIDTPANEEPAPKLAVADISNTMIDAVVSGRRDRALLAAWNKIVGTRVKAAPVVLRFPDTEAQWERPAERAVGISLNLMNFRHNDGSVNIEALRHAVRLAVALVDLNQPGQALAIGYANLAPLLMALALPYDSDAARATAAAISGIITAEAYAASAELARMCGALPEFAAQRETALRALRNHRRAAYGEQNDYEKIAVTPLPLALASCPDLALTAAVRSGWDRALAMVQAHGLRHLQVTDLSVSPFLTTFMESESNGSAPLRSLSVHHEEGRRALHPSAVEALTRLGYDSRSVQAMSRHVAGALTLEKAPAINHASLRARGFNAEALEKVEAYLPQGKHLRFVVTPWIVGVEFCRKTLKIPVAKIEDPRFNLLAHLGFSEADIRAADQWCYGRDDLGDAASLNRAHMAVFATTATLQPEAVLRMAAAVQGFVSGETGLRLHLPLGIVAESYEKLVLEAWRRGVKSAAIVFDAELAAAQGKSAGKITQKSKLSAFLHAKAPALPKPSSRTAAPRLGMAYSKAKSRPASKTH